METLAVAVVSRLISLGSLRLGLFSTGGVLDQLTWRLVLLLGTHTSLLLFHLKHHPSLLLLLFYSLVIWPISLCLSIPHFRFLLFFLLLFNRLHLYYSFVWLLYWHSCSRLWWPCWTFISFVLSSYYFCFLLSFSLCIKSFFPHNFLKFLLILFVDNRHLFGHLLNR